MPKRTARKGTAETVQGRVDFHLIPHQGGYLGYWIALHLDCGHTREIDLREVPGAVEDPEYSRRMHQIINGPGGWAGFPDFIAERLDGRDLSEAIAKSHPHDCGQAN